MLHVFGLVDILSYPPSLFVRLLLLIDWLMCNCLV